MKNGFNLSYFNNIIIMEKVVIYSRVSTDSQDNSSQIEDLKRYCIYRKFELIQVFEEHISGATKGKNRPFFKQMFDFILNKDNEIKFVLCWELSRFGRSNLDVLNNINLLKDNEIYIIFKKENIDTSSNDPTTALTLNILSSISEFERHSIVDRTRRGLHHHLKNGGSHSLAPFGYTNVDKKIVISEKESIVVKEIFTMYANGTASPSIAKHLNNKETPTKKGKKWHDETIRGILKNTLYIGKRNYEIGEQPCPRIIDDEIFAKVQELFKTHENVNKDKIKFPNYLKGKIKCGVCQQPYFQHARENRHDFAYKCLSHRQVTLGVVEKRCENNGININILNSMVYYTLLNISQLFVNQGVTNTYIEETTTEIKNKKDRLNVLLNNTKTDLKKAKIKLQNIDNKYINGGLRKEAYLNSVDIQKKIIDNLTDKINSYSAGKIDFINVNNTVRAEKITPNADNFQQQIKSYIVDIIVGVANDNDVFDLIMDIIPDKHFKRLNTITINTIFGGLFFLTVSGFNQFTYIVKDKEFVSNKGLKGMDYLLVHDVVNDKLNKITVHNSIKI